MRVNKRTTHYVIFWHPGSFVAEESRRDVESADPRKVKWPDSAYAFRLFKREDVIDGDKVYEGKPEQLGPLYYHPDSAVQSLDEARANPRATKILISNMERNGWKQIIWTRWGSFPQPFEPGKVAVLK
jgi:hypothetical protein